MNEPGTSLTPPVALSAPITIVSANRPGAEAGALDAAVESGVDVDGCAATGGAHPRGLVDSANPGEALHRNVRDSDATVVVVFGGPDAGDSALAIRIAKKMGKPCMTVALPSARSRLSEASARQLAAWLRKHGVGRLHVTGPSEAKAPGIEAATANAVGVLLEVLAEGLAG